MSEITLHLGDCLEIMRGIADKSVDAIITDLPYGTTACKWDEIIPFAPMWEQVKRILKPRGVFVTTASQPFTSKLVMSNPRWFKYEIVWDKANGSSGLLARVQPIKNHENILVFGDGATIYNPIMTKAIRRIDPARTISNGEAYSGNSVNRIYDNGGEKFPKSILQISNANQIGKVHPTQKPAALYEYLIRTYTNEGDTVLDICAGSGTTGIAAMNTGRNAILIEKEPKYFEIAKRRIAEAQPCLIT